MLSEDVFQCVDKKLYSVISCLAGMFHTKEAKSVGWSCRFYELSVGFRLFDFWREGMNAGNLWLKILKVRIGKTTQNSLSSP